MICQRSERKGLEERKSESAHVSLKRNNKKFPQPSKSPLQMAIHSDHTKEAIPEEGAPGGSPTSSMTSVKEVGETESDRKWTK